MGVSIKTFLSSNINGGTQQIKKIYETINIWYIIKLC